jgi:hypothetical protein
MRIILLSFIALALTACSKPYDKYVGYWQLDDSKRQKILEIRKEDKDTYLVNENVFQTTDLLGKSKKEQVLEKTENDGLGVNNGLTVIPFNLSDDGKTLRIMNNKYSKISDDDAKKALDNNKACKDLRTQYQEEIKPISFANSETAKRNQIGEKYIELQKKIPNCDLNIHILKSSVGF